MTNSEAESHDRTALPQEMASAMNLMAHPMAGFAAMGALGFGLASQAMGIWMGSVAGMAEAARRMAEDGVGDAAGPVKQPSPKLRLVSVSAIPDGSIAPVAGTVKRDTVEVGTAGVKKARASRKEAASRAVAAAKASEATAQPRAMEEPAAPDDLKAIAGVGPKLAQVLNGLGLWTYRQVAALEPAEIAWLDDHLGFSGRIDRDDWIGQAKRLSGAR